MLNQKCCLTAQSEVLLNIDFKLKTAEPLMNAGQTVAYNQFIVTEDKHSCCAFDTPAQAVTSKIKLENKKKSDQIIITSDNMNVSFDKNTGLLKKYTVLGNDMLGEGGTLKPNFWRAPTDNDMGAGIHRSYKAWKNPDMKLIALTATKDKKGNTVTVKAEYDLASVESKLTISYVVTDAGAIHVFEKMTTSENMKAKEMFRYGAIQYG